MRRAGVGGNDDGGLGDRGGEFRQRQSAGNDGFRPQPGQLGHGLCPRPFGSAPGEQDPVPLGCQFAGDGGEPIGRPEPRRLP